MDKNLQDMHNLHSDIIFGRNAVTEALRSGREAEYLMCVRGAKGAAAPIIAECKKRGIPVKELPREKLDYKLAGQNHQGVALVVSSGEYCELEELIDRANENAPALIMILDGIEDPHNLGAVIRTAEAAGATGIIIPKRRSAGLNATVAKVASGALEYVPVCRVSNLAAAVEKLKKAGIWIYGADMDGEDIYSTDLRGPCAIVIGSEGAGMSRIIRESCDFIVKIPMYGKINSLNASVAAGVIMYETVRQRHK